MTEHYTVRLEGIGKEVELVRAEDYSEARRNAEQIALLTELRYRKTTSSVTKAREATPSLQALLPFPVGQFRTAQAAWLPTAATGGGRYSRRESLLPETALQSQSRILAPRAPNLCKAAVSDVLRGGYRIARSLPLQ